MSLVTSRGCPYRCSFCSIHIHAGRRYRRYSVEHTLDHIETLVNRLGVKHIHFEDDNLTLDRDRFHRLMDGVLERQLRFTWDTPNGVFANTLDLEMMQKMKATGCTYLVVGVESGDQWVLDNVIAHADSFQRHTISTREFTPELLEQLNSEFHREAMRIIATKTAAFLARHPSVALTNGAYFARSVAHDNNPLKDSVVKLFFCRLFYRNCLLSEAQGPAAPVPPARRRAGPLSAAAR
ncbi:B12-binding domain-containing radical SAM protein [Sorangium sp. So ce1128]